jgi:hypothetical protein
MDYSSETMQYAYRCQEAAAFWSSGDNSTYLKRL